MIDFKGDRAVWGFAVFWTGFMLAADGFVVSGLVEAVRSEQFDTTPGIVTKSEIKRGGRGSAHFNVEYVYTVNGQQYTGTKYDIQPHFLNNAYWYAARDANPVGAPVKVHYDPAAPATAYLAPGVRSDALFVVWWMVPFNLVALGFAWAGWGILVGRRGFDPALSRCARETCDGWLARPDPQTRFVICAFVILFAITFCGCFVAGAYAVIFQFPPPWWVPLSMWVVALVVPVVLGRQESELWVLHINDREGILKYPHNGNRVAIHREQVLGLDATAQARKNKNVSYEVFSATVRWRDTFDQEQRTALAEYANAEDAFALVAWLSDHLGLQVAARDAV